MAFTNLVQIGYQGTAGPVFNADAGNGKLYCLIYDTEVGITGLRVKEPQFASNLGLDGSKYTLGSYSASQTFSDVPQFKQPATGPNFSGFNTDVANMVTATTVPGQTGTSTTTTTTTGGGTTTTSSGTTTTTTGGGTTTTTGGGTTYSAPTFMEQLSTFLSNYWWLVALGIGFLLWKPVIAPALGMGKRRRR